MKMKKEKYCAFHRLSSSVMGRMMVFRPHKTIRVYNGKCIGVNRLHAMRSISDKIRLWKKIWKYLPTHARAGITCTMDILHITVSHANNSEQKWRTIILYYIILYYLYTKGRRRAVRHILYIMYNKMYR